MELGTPKSLERLQNFPKLGFTRGNKSEEWRLHSGVALEIIKFTPRITSNNYWVLIDSPIYRLGVAFMPSFWHLMRSNQKINTYFTRLDVRGISDLCDLPAAEISLSEGPALYRFLSGRN